MVNRDNVNRRLYSPINVLRTFGSTYEDMSQDWYVSTQPMPGASTVPVQLYGYRRYGQRQFVLRELTVPGTTQTNKIGIWEDAGGHLVNWTYTDAISGTAQVMNTFMSFGRGFQAEARWFEELSPIRIESITKGVDQTILTLSEKVPFESKKPISMIIAGVTNADNVGGGAPLNGERFGFASATTSDYRRRVVVTADTSVGDAGIGTYVGGTVVFKVSHNPNPGGTIFAQNPGSNSNENDTRNVTCDGVFSQGSPLVSSPIMTLLGPNQGYVETICVPLNFDDNIDRSDAHGGNKYNPVIWHNSKTGQGIRIKTQLWINFEGHEGVHKMVCTVINDAPIAVDPISGLAVGFDCFLRYGLGEGSGQPIIRAVSYDPFYALKVFTNGTTNHLNDIVWPGASAGFYQRPSANRASYFIADQNAAVIGGDYVDGYPSGVPTIHAGNPFHNHGSGNGGGVFATSPSDTRTFGLWGVKPGNQTLNLWYVNPVHLDVNNPTYTTDGFTSMSLSLTHNLHPTNGLVPVGEHAFTSWAVTGDSTALFHPDNGLALFNLMNSKAYF